MRTMVIKAMKATMRPTVKTIQPMPGPLKERRSTRGHRGIEKIGGNTKRMSIAADRKSECVAQQIGRSQKR